MEKEASQSADLYYLAAWAHANRKRLTTIGIVVAAVAIIVGGYFWYQTGHENEASLALSEIKMPMTPQEAALPQSPQPYLKVAENYSGTTAAARALLVAGSIEFDTGKFADAEATFQKFMNQYPASPLANQAQIGIAASLEAQGKIKEATARYEDITRHRADSTTPQAKSALARLYVAQGKPELAFALYDDLARAGNNDSWSAEAPTQRQELLDKYPSLQKAAASSSVFPATSSPVAPQPAKSSATVTIPAATNVQRMNLSITNTPAAKTNK